MSNPIPAGARNSIYERDMFTCVRCGLAGSEIHHRKRRREGGHGLENMILLCSVCHRTAHQNPAWAREKGLIVSVHVDDVSTVPLHTFSGWVRLNPDGRINHTNEPEKQ